MYILLIGLAILLSSCASTTSNYYSKTVSSWEGGNVNNLIKSWGRPDSYTTSPDGTRIFVYRDQSSRYNHNNASPSVGVNTQRTGHPVLTNQPSTNRNWQRGVMSQTCTAAFVANKAGKIINTDVQGTGCFATEDFLNRHSNPNGSQNLAS